MLCIACAIEVYGQPLIGQIPYLQIRDDLFAVVLCAGCGPIQLEQCIAIHCTGVYDEHPSDSGGQFSHQNGSL